MWSSATGPARCRSGTPRYFARTPEEADQLIWDSNGRVNLANFLPRRQEKIAVVAKGCDARNIINHMVENQISRDRVHIIGVPCEGMVDPALIQAQVPDGKSIYEVVEDDGQITVKGRDFAVTRGEGRSAAAKLPDLPAPEPARVRRVGGGAGARNGRGPVPGPGGVAGQIRGRALGLLTRTWSRIASGATPAGMPARLCYCQVCFVDETKPQWVGKSQDATDVLTFHLLRAYHCAGRCTDCGACESACPVGIKVRQFTRVLEKSIKERYGYEAGLDPAKKPPLTVFLPDDPQEFIK